MNRSSLRRPRVRRMSVVISLVFAMLGTLVAPAEAAELSVPSKRFPSLQKALRKAKKGDVIRLAPGEYRLKRLNLGRHGVTLEGNGATIRLRRDRRRVKLRGKESVFRNIRFEGAAVKVRGKGARVEDCTFDGDFPGEAVILAGEDNRLEGCDLRGVRLHHRAAGLVTVFGRGAVVADNLLHVNGADTRASYPAVFVLDELGIVADNTITARQRGEDVGVRVEADRTIVSDNLFRGLNGPAVDLRGQAARVATNRILDHRAGPLLKLDGNAIRVTGNVIDGGPPRLEPVLRVSADEAEITDNTVTGADGPGFLVIGQGVRVERNSLTGVGRGLRTGIRVIGDGARLAANEVARLGPDSDGFRVQGDGAEITSNTITNPDTYASARDGIVLHGDDGELTGNETEWVADGVHVLGNRNLLAEHVSRRVREHGLNVDGDDNTMRDNVLLQSRWDGVAVRGDGNRVTDCRATGVLAVGPAGPSRGFSLIGNGNTLTTSTADDLRWDGVWIAGDDNVVDRVVVAAPGDALLLAGDRNEVRDCEVTASGVAGFGVVRGVGNVFLCCTGRGGSPGFQVGALGAATRLEQCASDGALGDGLENAGVDSTILDSTFLGSAGIDVVSPAPPLLQSGNTFETGGFPAD